MLSKKIINAKQESQEIETETWEERKEEKRKEKVK